LITFMNKSSPPYVDQKLVYTLKSITDCLSQFLENSRLPSVLSSTQSFFLPDIVLTFAYHFGTALVSSSCHFSTVLVDIKRDNIVFISIVER
jgi:hypothetical protein